MACLAHRAPVSRPPVFLLFLQLLHGALVREHRGDGCKYLIAGDLLAAGRVPHFGGQERNTVGYTNRHRVVQASGFDRDSQTQLMQYVVLEVLQRCQAFSDALGQSAGTLIENSSEWKSLQKNYYLQIYQIFLCLSH